MGSGPVTEPNATRIGPTLARRNIAVRPGDETVVHVEVTGSLHLLDEAATTVLALCDGTRTRHDIASMIARRYDRPEIVSVEVSELLEHLTQLQILTECVEQDHVHV